MIQSTLAALAAAACLVVTALAQPGEARKDDSTKTTPAGKGEGGKEKMLTLGRHKMEVSSLALSSDGKKLCSGSWDETITVWDLDSGKEIHTLRGHTDRVMSIAVSSDGKRLVSGSWDKTVKVWDLEAGKELLTLRGPMKEFGSVALFSDGKRLV